MKYNIQYSRPTKTKIAISDWNEYIIIIEATSKKEAINKFFKKQQETGAFLLLDCWEEKSN